MMNRALILFTCLPLVAVDAGFDINFKASSKEDRCAVEVTGEDRHVITDEEIAFYNLSDEELKKGMKGYFRESPKDVGLKGAMHEEYNYQPVHTRIRVSESKMTGVSAAPVIVCDQIFENSLNKTVKYTAAMQQTVEHTCETSWNKESTVGASATVTVSAWILEASATVQASHSWGSSSSKGKSITIGTSTGAEVELGPGESCKLVLTANRGLVNYIIKYLIDFVGNIAGYFVKREGVSAVNFDYIFKHEMKRKPYTTESYHKVGFYSQARVSAVPLE